MFVIKDNYLASNVLPMNYWENIFICENNTYYATYANT